MTKQEIDPREMPAGTKVWVYLRHSPGDNQTLESQESAVLKLCEEKRWRVDRIFRDRWKKGSDFESREAFEQMIYLARQKPRPAEMIIVWNLGRFGRDQTHSQFYRADLRMNGWQVLSISDNIPAGDLAPIFEALIDWRNEQFLIDLRASTLRGQSYVVECGCVPSGRIAFGYDVTDLQIGTRKDCRPRVGRKPVVNQDLANVVLRAFELKAHGATNAIINRELGIYSGQPGPLNYLFTNRAYLGEYEYHGQVFKNVYPPIVSPDLFEAVQKHVKSRPQRGLQKSNHPRRRCSKFFLANIAICAFCGNSMEGKSVSGYRYYVCSAHNTRTSKCPDSSLIPANELEEEIVETLLDQIINPQHLEELLNWTNCQLNEGLNVLENRLRDAQENFREAEMTAIKMARNFGTMENPSKIVEKALHEQEALVDQFQQEICSLRNEIIYSRIEVNQGQILEFIQRARLFVEKGEFFDLREFVEQLCSRIVISSEECRLEIHFPNTVSQ